MLLVSLAAALTASTAHAAPVAIYPLGDSITWGATLSIVPTPGGYRGYLHEALEADGIAHTFVGTSSENPPLLANGTRFEHDGWPGLRIDQDAEALDGPSPANGGYWLTGTPTRAPIRPDVVVVLLGTNDIQQSHDPDHMAARLTALLRKLHRLRPRAGLVVCTIPPLLGAAATVAAYNHAIRDTVVPRMRKRGARVALADVNAAGIQISLDRVHPLPAGYQTMAAVIEPAIRSVLGQLSSSAGPRPCAAIHARAPRTVLSLLASCLT